MRQRHLLSYPAAAAALVLLATPAIAGNTGAIQVDVVDASGAAVAGAALIVTDPVLPTFRMEGTTDRKGRAMVIGLAPKDYTFRVEKEGFQAYESNFSAHAGDTERKKVTLNPIGAGAVIKEAAGGAAEVVEKQTDPTKVAYNEAVALYRQDKDEEALARLTGVLAEKPDFAPAVMLKGIILEEHGTCEEAIPLLKQAHGADPTASAALGPLIRCLDRTGQKDEAASYRKIQAALGRSKADLYNEAVLKINAGDDAGAAPLLEQAIRQDAAFAAAQYQYGLILFRRGDVAGTITRLETYLQLAPAGEFAADAGELLKALKP